MDLQVKSSVKRHDDSIVTHLNYTIQYQIMQENFDDFKKNFLNVSRETYWEKYTQMFHVEQTKTAVYSAVFAIIVVFSLFLKIPSEIPSAYEPSCL